MQVKINTNIMTYQNPDREFICSFVKAYVVLNETPCEKTCEFCKG